MSYFDGHLHSTASDGRLAPAALVDAVRAARIHVMALTDHDTFAGHAEAAGRAAEVGVEFIPGVEMSVDLDGREIHVLAYFVSTEATALAQALDEARAERRRHLAVVLARLAELGYPLSEAEVLAEVTPGAGGTEPSIGRPHIARALVRKGYMRGIDEVFARLLGDKKPGHVRRRVPDAARMIAIARAAGALCSIAHPSASDVAGARLDRLAQMGLGGIEVYHPDHDLGDQVHYLRECHRLGLVPTGGSDFHGPPAPLLTHGMPGLSSDDYARFIAHRRR